MHEHAFKKTRRIGAWMRSAESGILVAHEEWVNLCACGEVVRIKTSHVGTWKKAEICNTGRASVYPTVWRDAIRAILKVRYDSESDIVYPAERAVGLTGMAWHEFEEMAGGLLRDGIVAIFEPYPKNTRRAKIAFRSEIVATLKTLLGLDAKDKEAETITAFFDAWEYPSGVNSLSEKVARIMDSMKGQWLVTGKAVVPTSSGHETIMKSLSNYGLLLESLRGIFNLTLRGDSMGLRELSTDIAGDSKAFERIKPYLRKILGDLGRFGVNEHSPLVYCKLPITGTVGGRPLDLSACDDYVSLTMKTARLFRPVLSGMKRLVLIENLTPFEMIAGEAGLVESGTGIVFLSGYPPGHVREFLKGLPQPEETLLWCDLDPDGIEIALTAAKWFKVWRPLFMDKEYLITSRTKPLEAHDHEKLSSLKGKVGVSVFGPLMEDMERLGVKVEQEAQKTGPLQDHL
ncbi:MAG: Wadjet anti-phage system protein JetD domain-containing protein [Nitrospirota bacterium]